MNNRNKKMLHLSAILTSGSNFGSWRLPEVPDKALLDFGMYRELTQAAERAKLDMIFFADSLAVNGLNRRVLEGVASGSFEPITLIAALAAATKKIGLAATLSTSYTEPYHIARKFAALDILSGGRSAWNAVTSLGATEAYNFGDEVPLEHALRYERADEFIARVRKLWQGTNAGQELPSYQEGSWFKDSGPLPQGRARSPQGSPVIIQAGGSEAFQKQAAKTAEVVFTAFRVLQDAQSFYARVKDRMAGFGRQRSDLKILPGIQPIIARTKKEAREKEQYVKETLLSATAISLLSARLGWDLSDYDPEGPLPVLPEPGPDVPSDTVSSRNHIEGMARAEKLSIRQLSERMAGARGHLTFVGTPAGFADLAQQWLEGDGCDGFNLMSSHLPGGLLEFIELAIPELQARGLFRYEYAGNTLREHLGLASADPVDFQDMG